MQKQGPKLFTYSGSYTITKIKGPLSILVDSKRTEEQSNIVTGSTKSVNFNYIDTLLICVTFITVSYWSTKMYIIHSMQNIS